MRMVLGLAVLLSSTALAHADTLYVDLDATGANDGSSWDHAFVDLQDALGAATAGDEVWVAEGTYSPTQTADWQSTFAIPHGVGVYGGFGGFETERAARDWELHATVLSGDLGLPPGAENSSDFIVTLVGTDSTTSVDGFTIRDGRHGIRIDGGNPRVANALVTDNSPYGGGTGAGVLVTGVARPAFGNVQLVSNHAVGGHGGGIYCMGADARASLEHVLFESNTGINGGGMLGQGDFNFVEFRDNIGDDFGGGLNGGGTLSNVSFVGNSAHQEGGGMYGGGQLTNVQFVGNSAQGQFGGGGLRGDGTLTNVVFDGNSAAFGGGMHSPSGGSVLTNVLFTGNEAGLSAAALLIGALPPYWNGAQDHDCEPTRLINVTITEPSDGVMVGPIWDRNSVLAHRGDLEVINSIIWSEAGIIEGVPATAVSEAGLTFSHSLIQGSGGSGVGWNSAFGTDLGNNLDEDPTFVDPPNGDYALSPTSPAIDAGDTGAVPAGVVTDLAGNPRFMNLAVDMGAYEAAGPLAIDEGPITPVSRRYMRVAPNPFNPSTTVYFGLERATEFTITVYDLAGRKVRTLQSGHLSAGDHEVQWHGEDSNGRVVASGVYICRIQGEDFVESQRLVLVK